MHDVRVALDNHAIGHLHAARLRDAADIVTAKVEQHHVFSDLLGISERARPQVRHRLRASRRAGRVPAIGLSVTADPSLRTRISGEAPTT